MGTGNGPKTARNPSPNSAANMADSEAIREDMILDR